MVYQIRDHKHYIQHTSNNPCFLHTWIYRILRKLYLPYNISVMRILFRFRPMNVE